MEWPTETRLEEQPQIVARREYLISYCQLCRFIVAANAAQGRGQMRLPPAAADSASGNGHAMWAVYDNSQVRCWFR